jgi:hypothetical protein
MSSVPLWGPNALPVGGGGRDGQRADAGVAQLVELQPSKLDVASSNLVARSTVLKRSGVPGVGWPLGLLEPT